MSSDRPTNEKLRGVNLGGWLVLERWMTPSLFNETDAADEYTFMQTPGSKEKLDRHRNTFITEKDFAWMASHGVNAVRIPVGYWLLDGDGPYIPGIEYLDWAVEMAGTYGLRVLIDLHGAKGSQNGYDHSGHAGKADWYGNRVYQNDTIETLVQLARRYRDAPALWGIELLNEPKINLLTFWTLRRFYREAYRQLQKVARPGTRIVFSDAFVPCLLGGTLKEASGHPVAMDVHWYQFGKADLEAYFAKLSRRPVKLRQLQKKQPVIIGEWSGMLSHESTAWLSDDAKAALEEQHIERQMGAYSTAEGWFFWTYKMEAPGAWNFRWLVEQGWVHLA